MFRPFDVVLYGASGFVGQQTVDYFRDHAPPNIRWAVAGRNRDKLAAVLAKAGLAGRQEMLVADSSDQTAIDAIVSQTRVVLNTAGPFALYGDAIVDSCVRFQTHYVDITGETPWIRSLIDRYHERASVDGTRIICCCGFDSVPSDLGAMLVVRSVQETFGQPCQDVKAYFRLKGGLNGGTLASLFNMYESGQVQILDQPFLLNPEPHPATTTTQRHDHVHFNSDLVAWAGPFVMAMINTRVVRRSAALFNQWNAGYGPDFDYDEFLLFKGTGGRLLANVAAAGLTAFRKAAGVRPMRKLLKWFLPAPGSGPSEQSMNSGRFTCDLVATAADGRKMFGRVSDRGDPGNRVTVKCVCESALALAVDFSELPGGETRGGILTPATGLGDVLVRRLVNSGMVLTAFEKHDLD